MNTDDLSYDQQAEAFDIRAGLSDAIAQRVADAVLRRGLRGGAGCVLEIGAGTGEVGRWLCKPDRRYVAIDSSSAMLERFRSRLSGGASAELICADANDAWPVDSDAVSLIFGSRVFHLLRVEHVLREALRVAHQPGAALLLGRVKRARDSVRTLMRKRMRELLIEHGVEPRPTERNRSQLLEQSLALGGEPVEVFEAARWQAKHRPIDSILAWRGKDSMGGIVPSAEVKDRVLTRLAQWATETFGDADKEFPTEEQYVIEGTYLKKNGGRIT